MTEVVEVQRPTPEKPRTGIHHLGYRAWTGRLAPGWMSWTAITRIGVQRAWQSAWLRRMLLFAWLPGLWFGMGVFVWEQAVVHPEWKDAVTPFVRGMPSTPEFDAVRASLSTGDLEGSRHTLWSWLLVTFFRYPQGLLMVMILGLIAPPLISQDIRSRAFLVYFSRPLTRAEYLLGKLATLWLYTAMISTLPALCVYGMGVLLSPTASVVVATWDVPLRILAASIVLVLPTSVLALSMSSMTQESRYATFAWFAVWILGWFTYGAATSAENINVMQSGRRQRVFSESLDSPWTHLSLYHTLGRVQRWVFGFTDLENVVVSMAILVALTMASLVVLVRRISAPMRV